METVLDGKAVRGEISFQRFAEPRRAAKPDARLAPLRYRLAHAFAGQASVTGIDQHMQTHIGGSGIGRQFAEGLLVNIGGGMEQIDRSSSIRRAVRPSRRGSLRCSSSSTKE